jgi:hypothetical protein
VLRRPITWSAEQVEAPAAHVAEADTRPTQRLDDRTLGPGVVAG